MFGEFGTPASDSTGTTQTFFDTVLSLLADEPWALGAFCWALSDQSDSASNQWGLIADSTGLPRAGAPIFSTFPVRQPARPKLVLA